MQRARRRICIRKDCSQKKKAIDKPLEAKQGVVTPRTPDWEKLCLECPPHQIGHTLPEDWVKMSKAFWEAEKRQKDPKSPLRILFISGSARDQDTCPQEKSKTEQLLEKAMVRLRRQEPEIEIDWLDLGDMTAGKKPIIHPCKSCFSTSMSLCVTPCNCYPNDDLGQSSDWMGEIYPKWMGAHGIVLATPVKWYMPDGPVVLMMQRMVCLDGGNPDPHTIGWKDKDKAKKLELSKDYKFVKYLAGRAIGLIVHGDVAGESVALNSLTLTFQWMGLEIAGPHAIGEFRIAPKDGSYANNQQALYRNHNPTIECITEEINTIVDSVVQKARLLRKDYQPILIPEDCRH